MQTILLEDFLLFIHMLLVILIILLFVCVFLCVCACVHVFVICVLQAVVNIWMWSPRTQTQICKNSQHS